MEPEGSRALPFHSREAPKREETFVPKTADAFSPKPRSRRLRPRTTTRNTPLGGAPAGYEPHPRRLARQTPVATTQDYMRETARQHAPWLAVRNNTRPVGSRPE